MVRLREPTSGHRSRNTSARPPSPLSLFSPSSRPLGSHTLTRSSFSLRRRHRAAGVMGGSRPPAPAAASRRRCLRPTRGGGAGGSHFFFFSWVSGWRERERDFVCVSVCVCVHGASSPRRGGGVRGSGGRRERRTAGRCLAFSTARSDGLCLARGARSLAARAPPHPARPLPDREEWCTRPWRARRGDARTHASLRERGKHARLPPIERAHTCSPSSPLHLSSHLLLVRRAPAGEAGGLALPHDGKSAGVCAFD